MYTHANITKCIPVQVTCLSGATAVYFLLPMYELAVLASKVLRDTVIKNNIC